MTPSLYNFLLSLRGLRLAAVTILSLAYGWLIISGLPFWQAMEVAQGGPELQTRFFYSANDATLATASIATTARTEALWFYGLDVFNAVLFGMSLAGLIGLGLRLWGQENGSLRHLILVPILSGVLDIIENLFLALTMIGPTSWKFGFFEILGATTGLKLLAGNASIIIMLGLVIPGIVLLVFRKFPIHRKQSVAMPSRK